MKRYLPLAALLLLALASISFSQTTPAASPSPSPKPKPAMTKAQILKKLSAAETKLWEAWKNKDAKPFKASLSADFVMIADSGVTGKNDVVKMMASMPCEVKSVQLSDWKLAMLNSSTALLTYKGMADGTCGGTAIPPVWASSVWVNRGGKWLAASHQETPIAK
jgi:hypothetical protein